VLVLSVSVEMGLGGEVTPTNIALERSADFMHCQQVRVKLRLLEKSAATLCYMAFIGFLAGVQLFVFSKVGEHFEGGVARGAAVWTLVGVRGRVALEMGLAHETLIAPWFCADEGSFSCVRADMFLQLPFFIESSGTFLKYTFQGGRHCSTTSTPLKLFVI